MPLTQPKCDSPTAPAAPTGSRVLFCRTLEERITVSTTPRRLVGGGVFTALLLLFVLLNTHEFLDKDVPYGGLLYGLSLGAAAVLGTLTFLRWSFCSRRLAAGVSTGLVLLLPIVAMTMVECLNGVFIFDWSPQVLLINYILYPLFYGIVYVCSGSFRLPMLIINPLLFLLALTNHYVYAFRGTPFLPMDLFAAGTAANVASAYDFSPDYQIVIATLLLTFLIIAGYKLCTPAFGLVGKLATRLFCGTLAVCVMCIYLFTDLYAQAGLAPDFWNQSRGYHRSGVLLNFCLNTKYVRLDSPAGYDSEGVDDIVAGVLGESPDNLAAGTATTDAPPNIICVMNESLADLRVLGDMQTNVPYMPFLDSLTENTIRGNLVVPVIGSGTSNTEFEFLTGVSTGFFPTGSNAYMLYVNEPLPSLVSTLQGQGYTAQAFHPYYASGWNRLAVYTHFGFSRFTSLGSIIPNDILAQYSSSGADVTVLRRLVEERFPDENILLRRYVSDSRNYREVIELYEQRDRSQPFFLFNVTMQNHGGYKTEEDGFSPHIWVSGLSGEAATAVAAGEDIATAYPQANRYLSLMKYSDDAFAELIAYFEQVEEPTVICLFGDHQPTIESAYIQALMGTDSLYSLSAEEELNRHITPFYIWANYDIPEQTVERLSVNYLSSYLLQTAGVELPVFNRYLLRLSETLPVASGVGCYDRAGNFYKDGDSSPYATLWAGYRQVAYNAINDSEGRQNRLFYLN